MTTDLLQIVQAGIRAVDAGRLVETALERLPDSTRPVWLIAAGKAALPMADAASRVLSSRLQGGVVVSPGGVPPAPLEGVVGEHPQPGPGSEEGGRRALAIAAATPADDELIVLISGGASSLMAVPDDGLTLDDKREATGVLLRSGADIYALNTVRKHLSTIKGGRLAAACRAPSHAFVLSDVVGDDLQLHRLRADGSRPVDVRRCAVRHRALWRPACVSSRDRRASARGRTWRSAGVTEARRSTSCARADHVDWRTCRCHARRRSRRSESRIRRPRD
ncbi:MAG: glycerate-2-kinase family protein [Vicinamibacterales bacterium]